MGLLGVFIVTVLFLGVAGSKDFDLSDVFDFSQDTTTASPRRPGKQECPNVARDIVLLIDGSSSVRTGEFIAQKLFVSAFSKTFPENTLLISMLAGEFWYLKFTYIKAGQVGKHWFNHIPEQWLRTFKGWLFSLLQFSNKIQEHFDFRTFRNNRNLNNALQNINQLQGSSYTATAIKKAVELFTPQKGARSNAQKFLVVVTDGEKVGDPLNYPEVVQEADRAGITRFAVGVGLMVSSRLFQQELHAIASRPATEHTFLLRQFSDLMSIQLKEKICASHGTVVPQPTLAPPISCTSCSDSRVLQKLEQLVQGLDQVKSKLDLLAAKVGKCGHGSHR